MEAEEEREDGKGEKEMNVTAGRECWRSRMVAYEILIAAIAANIFGAVELPFLRFADRKFSTVL